MSNIRALEPLVFAKSRGVAFVNNQQEWFLCCYSCLRFYLVPQVQKIRAIQIEIQIIYILFLENKSSFIIVTFSHKYHGQRAHEAVWEKALEARFNKL